MTIDALIARVKILLRDKSEADNYLLDDVEFSQEEIVVAIESVVDEWNETQPVIRKYTPTSFPYRHHMMDGIRSVLFGIAADNYHRNHLDYAAGGVTIGDKNKGDLYLKKADYYYGRWRAFMEQQKRTDNLNSAWRSVRAR